MRRTGLLLAFLLTAGIALAQNPKWAKWQAQADTALDHGDYEQAIKYYTKFIEAAGLKDKNSFAALYRRAVAYYSAGNFSKAVDDLDQFIASYPDFPQARLLRALVHKELGNKDQQLKDLADALKSQPGNAALLKWRASLYLEDDEYELAKKDALLAKLFGDDAETETYLAVSLYNLGKTDSAFQAIDQAITLDATYLPAYLYGGSFGLEIEQFDRALQYLDLALRLDPRNSSAIFYKGIALAESDRAEEGCRCLRKAFYSGMDEASDYLAQYCFGKEN